MNKRLLVLDGANEERDSDGPLPALDRYDGPAYRVLREFLREYQWPQDLSVAVLSSEYGLIGILKEIEHNGRKMDSATPQARAHEYSALLVKWAASHGSVHLSLGAKHLTAIQHALQELEPYPEVIVGQIGEKLHRIKTILTQTPTPRRVKANVEGGTGRYRYFLPDWDDLLDPAFDFHRDSFSRPHRAEREDKHCSVLMEPKMSDGILVSLGQQGTQKGPLKRLKGTEVAALSPVPLRSHFGLSPDQLLFGDCGAFTYVNEENPTMTVDRAVALYETYGFDFGASVDHIPVKAITRNGERVALTESQRQRRVDITKQNAQLFWDAAKLRNVQFTPVGTIQGLNPAQYAQSVQDYHDMGYRHLAIGGLVPLMDAQIESIVRAVMDASDDLKERPWIHLFGIYRPRLQGLFRQRKVDSFDSASYFRKAWLRSDQNYLGTNGSWYAALRVPMTSDGRTQRRLRAMNGDLEQLRSQEQEVLALLSRYESGESQLEEVLEAILEYDSYLTRSTETESMRVKYRRTLEDKPWLACECNFCRETGIHMLVFRGANRNKRRGAHNTLMLYNGLTAEGTQESD